MSDLRQSILKRLEMLQDEQRELKVKREMIADALASDANLKELEEEMKKATNRYRMEKAALMNEPENVKVMVDLKLVRLNIKEAKELLSSELLGYFHQNDSFELKDEDGDIYRMTFSGKLKPSDQSSLFETNYQSINQD